MGCDANVPKDSVEARVPNLPVAHQSPTEAGDGVPTVRSLSAPYPNPVLSGASMDLAIPAVHVGRYTLQVYDVLGRRLVASEREIADPGRYRIEWAGRDAQAARVAAGVYFLMVNGPNEFRETRKVTVLK